MLQINWNYVLHEQSKWLCQFLFHLFEHLLTHCSQFFFGLNLIHDRVLSIWGLNVRLIPPQLKSPPYPVIYTEEGFTQSFFRITTHESHHPFQLPQSMLHHSTFFQRSIPSVILPEVPSFHYLLQQFPSLLLIRLTNHPRPYSFAMPSVKIYTTYIYAR